MGVRPDLLDRLQVLHGVHARNLLEEEERWDGGDRQPVVGPAEEPGNCSFEWKLVGFGAVDAGRSVVVAAADVGIAEDVGPEPQD